jgi:hypothetical protein
LTLGGCIPLSLQPVYTDETVVFEEKLLGKWSGDDDNGFWEFTKEGDNKYKLRISEDGSNVKFEGHLFKLEENLFLDLYPEELDLEDSIYKYQFIPAHSVMRIHQIDPNLKMSFMNPEFFDDEPNSLKHQVLEESEQLVITASTEEIQHFLIEHANDPNVFKLDGSTDLIRRKPLYNEKDVKFDNKLIGTWENDDGKEMFDFAKNESENVYNGIYLDDDDKQYEFAAHLVEKKNVRLLGVYFEPDNLDKTDPCEISYIPDYCLLIKQIEPELLIDDITYDKVGGLFENPVKRDVKKEQDKDYFFKGSRMEK